MIEYLNEVSEVKSVCEEVEPEYEQVYKDGMHYKTALEKGRAQHLEMLERREVHELLPVPQDIKPLSMRWVDVPQPDGSVKSRCTARGYEQALFGWEDHYAGTPAVSMLRLLLCLAVLLDLSVAIGDCSQAFYQADLEEEVWVRPPPEAQAPVGTAWRLRKAMPGLKGSPAAWSEHVNAILTQDHGLTQSQAEPCVYGAPKDRLWTLRHMDDFCTIGPPHRVRHFMESTGGTLSMSGVTYLDDLGAKARFLGIDLERIEGGFEESVNQDIFQALSDDAGLGSNSTPRTKLPGALDPVRADDEVPAHWTEHAYYRTQTGRLLFISHHRPDMQQTVGVLCKKIANPNHRDLRLLKKCIRYCVSTRHRVLRLTPKGKMLLSGHGDSDWAGDRVTRKSTSGGCLFLAGALLLSYSRGQSSPATSSCEAELYALGSLAAEGMFLHTFLTEQGFEVPPPLLCTDSSSALRVAKRWGLSKLKHIELRYMALQHWRKEHRIVISWISTHDNIADFLTKAVDFEIHSRCTRSVGLA